MELWCGCGVGEGYVVCDGSEVSIGEQGELYKGIGDKYNSGCSKGGYISVGELRGRFVVGYDGRNYEQEGIGNSGGEGVVSVSLDEIGGDNDKIRFKEEKWGENGNNGGLGNDSGGE